MTDSNDATKNTVRGWKAPRIRTAYTLTATTTLVSTALVDANPGNNTGSTTIRLV